MKTKLKSLVFAPLLTLVGAFGMLTGGSAGFAQTGIVTPGPSPGPTPVIFAGTGNYVDPYGTSNYGSPEAANFTGLGRFAYGLGKYNLYTAEAMEHLENARAKYMENYMQAIRNRYALKKMNAEYRAAEWTMTPQQIAHIAELKKPERLDAAQYSPTTGKLNWPSVLMGPEFARERKALEFEFAMRRPEDIGANTDFSRRVSELAKEMHARMTAEIDFLTTTESIAARKFLTGLQTESRLPPNGKALAVADR